MLSGAGFAKTGPAGDFRPLAGELPAAFSRHGGCKKKKKGPLRCATCEAAGGGTFRGQGGEGAAAHVSSAGGEGVVGVIS